jgi:thiamine biosynthesis protein ThiI
MTSSEDISKEVGATIFHRLNLKVSLKKPDITLFLDIKDQAAFLYFEKELCLGGYPLNSLGKGLMLLSGGIDSPVASYLLIKRGIKLDFIHFAAPPYTSEGVIYKLKDIIAVLNEYQVNSRLFVIPFTKLQETIYEMSDVSYAITIMRRMMVRISTLVAKKYRIPVLATGESVGQVASQTLSSINTINEVTIYPILRPLSVLDKVDIIKLSQGIGLYEISIRPFEDCCTIFPVINPKTRPRVKVSKSFEAKFDYQALIDEAVKNLRIIKVSSKDIL